MIPRPTLASFLASSAPANAPPVNIQLASSQTETRLTQSAQPELNEMTSRGSSLRKQLKRVFTLTRPGDHLHDAIQSSDALPLRPSKLPLHHSNDAAEKLPFLLLFGTLIRAQGRYTRRVSPPLIPPRVRVHNHERNASSSRLRFLSYSPKRSRFVTVQSR